VDYLAVPDRPWNLQADTGHLPAESSALTFAGNVILRPGISSAGNDSTQVSPDQSATDQDTPLRADPTGDSSRNAVMHTDFLTIDSQKNLATTDSPCLSMLPPMEESRITLLEWDCMPI